MSETEAAALPLEEVTATTEIAPEPEPHKNDPGKFRRLFEREEARSRELAAKVAEFEAAKTERERAEMSAAEKAQAEASEARQQAAAALRRAVVAENGLAADAMDFLTGEDEATLTEQAKRLSAMIGSRPPAAAGTTTNPGMGHAPSLDERIAAAEQSGDIATSITLKRQKYLGIGAEVQR